MKMGRLDRVMTQIARLLQYLKQRGEARWRDLYPSTLIAGDLLWRECLTWLLKYEYIEKPEPGLYRITQRGRELLESLTPFL